MVVVDLHLQITAWCSHFPVHLFKLFLFSFLRTAGLLFGREEKRECISCFFFFFANSPSNSPFPFCSLSNSIYGLSVISNAWENCHLMPPPAPAFSLSHSQFLNGLSFGLSLSPVFCQAGRLVLWRQTKGRFSSGPVSRYPYRQHGSLGRRHQTWSDQKKNHTHTDQQPGRQWLMGQRKLNRSAQTHSH